jgi:hypothetical protein
VEGPAPADLSVEGLTDALRACLAPDRAAQAEALADRMEANGARIAAERLISLLDG